MLVNRYHYPPCVPEQPMPTTLVVNQEQRQYPDCAATEICCINWTSFYQHPSPQPRGDTTQSTSRKDPATCLRLLLIVIFNFPFFDNIPVIEELYGEVFTKSSITLMRNGAILACTEFRLITGSSSTLQLLMPCIAIRTTMGICGSETTSFSITQSYSTK